MKNKPIILAIKETEEEIEKIINNAGLPAFFLRYILEKIEKDLVVIEQKEIDIASQKYNEELEKEAKKK